MCNGTEHKLLIPELRHSFFASFLPPVVDYSQGLAIDHARHAAAVHKYLTSLGFKGFVT